MREIPQTFIVGILIILCIHIVLSWAYIAEHNVKYKTVDVLQEKIDYMSKDYKKLVIKMKGMQ